MPRLQIPIPQNLLDWPARHEKNMKSFQKKWLSHFSIVSNTDGPTYATVEVREDTNARN
jgi:hypothetical protein